MSKLNLFNLVPKSLIILFICLNLNLGYLFSLPVTGKNKIYIPHLSIAPDVSETIRESFIPKLKAIMLEKFGDRYNIVCQSDLDLLIKQAESFQKQGRDSREILSEVEEARDADEIIHGKIFEDQGQIKILLNNLKRDPKTGDFYTKSIVDISFLEKDFDFYTREAAIKILNPHYKIKTGEAVVSNYKKKSQTKVDVEYLPDAKLISIGTVEWGNFEGLMKWEEAVDICEQKGMRLPTPEELRDMAHLKNHILREPCCVFWTSLSNKKDSDYAYYIDINDGYGNYYHKDIDVRVRCVKR